MQAIEISQFGKPEVLQLCERPMPEPQKGELLIQVHAAGVNRPDVFQRMGNYAAPKGASDLPGLEVAGIIVGGEVAGSQFAIGDEVCALVQGGGYAQYCVAPIAQCLPVPKGFSLLEAASLPETYFTVWSNVFDRAGLKKDESILIHGGTSGIGVAAIQIAKAMGHTVFTTAGSDEKCAYAKSIGADYAINYRTHNFVDIIQQHAHGQHVDVILDMVAGQYFEKNIACLADDGRLVVIALLGGAKAEIDLAQILRRRLTITGSTLRARPIEFKAEIAANLQKNVWPLLEAKKIKPMIYQTFPLALASQAHVLMESSEHCGKIMLQVI